MKAKDDTGYTHNLRIIRDRISKLLARIGLHEEATDNLLRSVPVWIASLLTGIVAVLYAKLFAWSEHVGMEIFSNIPWLFFIITPVCFVLAWQVVYMFAPFARGSGIPQVLGALEISGTEKASKVHLFVSVKIIVVKIISSIILVFGGGAVGREGPTIQISGSIFSLIGKFLPVRWPKYSERVMILTGSAAGLAAAFNTPLGGIVFAIEELSKAHFTAFRTSLLTAVIIGGMTAQMLLGPYLYLGYPKVAGLILSMTSLVILVAVIAGMLGAVFSKLVLRIIKVRSAMKTLGTQALFVMGLGLSITIIGFFLTPEVFGSGKETMISLLFGNEKYSDIFLAPARFFGPLVSFTCGASGGIFAPALSSGASIGAAISSFFILTPEQANVLVLSGMVAFLTAVTRSPFTSSILVLEMTDRHSLIFFLMFAGLISYASAWLVDRNSLYEQLKELYLHEIKDETPSANLQTAAK